MTTDYPHTGPFIMTETVTGAAVCVAYTGAVVRFHDADGEAFPGPIIAEYMVATLTTEPSSPDAALALDLGNKATWLGPETYGVIRAWVTDQI